MGDAMSQDTLVLIAAIVLTVIGCGAFFHYFLWLRLWPQTSGKVVGNEAYKSSHHGPDQWGYYPRVEFIAADGRTYEVRGDIGRQKEWPLGWIVNVRYRPANPNHASIAKDWQRLVFAGVFLGFAAMTWSVVLK